MIEKLRKLTGKKHVKIVDKGNRAILLALKLAKHLGKKRLFIQDQGGWITYRQYGGKLRFEVAELKTDYGIVKAADLTALGNNSVMLINSLTGYFAEQPMKELAEICREKGCLLINDVSGSIGTDIAKYGDVLVCSFGEWKPIDYGKLGFIAVDEKDWLDFIEDNFDMSEIAKSSRSTALAQSKQAISECQKPKVSEHAQKCTAFPTYAQEHAPPFRAAVLDKKIDFDEGLLNKKIDNLSERIKNLKEITKKIKDDLKDFEILHRNSDGINVVIKFNNEDEKHQIITYCEKNKYEYILCPRYIRVNENAVCIEVKRK